MSQKSKRWTAVRWARLGACGALFLGALLAPNMAQARGERMSDDEVRQAMITESIGSYPSVCACPYSTMRNGRSCGGRSAYSRPGGRSPLCYARDISGEMVRTWRGGR